MTNQLAAGTTALQLQVGGLQHDLQRIMRRFGRQCRGQGKVFVKLVRQTAQHLLEAGRQLLPLVHAAGTAWYEAKHLPTAQRERVAIKLQVALAAHQRIAKQSRRLTHGKPLPHCKIVKAYDGTIAPICKGKRNCPAQFGRKPGIIAEMAAGFIFAFQLPVGNPNDRSSGRPLLDGVQQASTPVSGRCSLAIHSLAGDLALNDASLRETLHARGILTVGIPRTVEPLTPGPSQEDVRRVLNEAGLHGKRTPHQVPLACACGYSRPVVERIIASLLCRGAARSTYKGHRGAVVQTGVTVMAHNAATWVRVQQNHLSPRAQKLRRLLRLKRHNVNEFSVSKY
jgi:hypothetical protein